MRYILSLLLRLTLNLAVHSARSMAGNPRIHLFIWEAGDNLSCVGGYASYRWWSPTGNPVQIGDKQVLSVLIDQSTWTNCYGEVDPAGFAKALANAQSVGFTFGGTFFGHGVSTTSGSATFTINSFTIQWLIVHLEICAKARRVGHYGSDGLSRCA